MNAYIISGFRSAVGKAPCLRQAGARKFHVTQNN
jgi:hypothetical protein